MKNVNKRMNRINENPCSRTARVPASSAAVVVAAILAAAALLSACGMFHLSDPLAQAKAANAADAAAAAGGAAGSGVAAGTGTIAISVPRVSSVILEALGISSDGAARTAVSAIDAAAGTGRAFLLASRVDFTLESHDDPPNSVQPWSTGEMQGLQPSAQIYKTIPAGSYTLTAKVYNNLVSASMPVVAGSKSFVVQAGSASAVIVPCVPNSEVAGLIQSLQTGTPAVGSLKPIYVDSYGLPQSWAAAEQWYSLTVPLGTFPRLSLDKLSTPVGSMAIAYVSDGAGHKIGACGTPGTGLPATFDIPQSTETAVYFIGVATATADNGLTTVPYTLKAEALLPRESLVNGDFSEGSSVGWKLNTWEGMTATYTVEAGEGVVSNIGSIGNGSLGQNPIGLVQGESYRIRFNARVDSGTGHLAINLMGGDFPDGRYYHDWPTDVDTEMQPFDYHFTWAEPSTLSAYVDILLIGCSGKTLRIDNAVLERSANPLAKPTLAIGTNALPGIVGKTVPLHWNEIAGATGYRVYRYVGALGEPVAYLGGTQTEFIDYGGKENTTYTYKVRAVSGTALGPFSNARVESTGVGAPLSGTIIHSGANGGQYMVFMDGFALTYSSTVDFGSGTGGFSINAGAPLTTPWNLAAWFDVDKNKLLDPGEYISWVDQQIWELNPTGTFGGLIIDTFVQAVDKPVLAKPVIKPDKKVFIRFFEPRTDGSLLRKMQKSSDGGVWTDVTVTDKGGNNNLYWLGYYDPSLESGVSFRWRVGTDLNSNGDVDESEYGAPTEPAQWYPDKGTLIIQIE